MKRYVTALLGIGAAAALTLAMGAAAASASTASPATASEHRLLRQRVPGHHVPGVGLALDAGGLLRPDVVNNQINLQARTDTNSTEDWYPDRRGQDHPDVLRYPN